MGFRMKRQQKFLFSDYIPQNITGSFVFCRFFFLFCIRKIRRHVVVLFSWGRKKLKQQMNQFKNIKTHRVGVQFVDEPISKS